MARASRLLVLGLLIALPLEAASRRPREVVQARGGGGLLLVSTSGRTWVEHPDGRRHRLSLRRGERLSALVELRSGWVATGHRDLAGRRDVLVFLADGAGVRRLPPPPGATAALRLRPVPVAERGRLGGLAWLEGSGPRSLSVRAADWTGVEWGPATAVSQPGPGGQAGLVSAVLEDGSWMLVWSAFDGRDTDLFWSRRRGAAWSAPRRLTADNGVPDITPALVAAGRGALVAWSRFEPNGYRLFTAAWSGTGWGPGRPVANPGSVFPAFLEADGRFLLLYRDAFAAGWTVLELDEDARALRRASAATPHREAPVVTGPDGRTLLLSWPAHREAAEVSWEPLP